MSPRKYSRIVFEEEGADGSLFGELMGCICALLRLLICRVHVGCVTVVDKVFFQVRTLRDASRLVIHNV
jgi:hypothetical protein